MVFNALMDFTSEEEVTQHKLLHGDNFPEEERVYGTTRLNLPLDLIAFYHELPTKNYEGQPLTRIFTHTHNIFDLVISFDKLQEYKTKKESI